MAAFLNSRMVFRFLLGLWILGSFSLSMVAQENQETHPVIEDPWFFIGTIPRIQKERVDVGSSIIYCHHRTIQRSSLEDVLSSQERLWEYLIHPQTPSCKRLEAASLGIRVFDLRRLPLLDETLELLRQYIHVVGIPQERHAFKKFEPMELLGFHWDPPDAQIPKPKSDAEYAATPWPWQVYRALRQLRHGLKGRVQKFEDRQIWYELAMEKPCGSPSAAPDFNKAMAWSTAFIPTEKDWPMLEEVTAIWRAMALNPDYVDSNRSIPVSLAGLHSKWFYTARRWVPQALLLEIMRDAPDPIMKLRVLEKLISLRNGHDGLQQRLWPIPATLTLAGMDFLNRDEISEMDRLLGAKYLIDVFYKPIPMHLNLRKGQPPHQMKAQFEKAMQWLETKRESLEQASRKELSALESANQWIPHSSRCGW